MVLNYQGKAEYGQSRPSRGAWIEIGIAIFAIGRHGVAPLAGRVD